MLTKFRKARQFLNVSQTLYSNILLFEFGLIYEIQKIKLNNFIEILSLFIQWNNIFFDESVLVI